METLLLLANSILVALVLYAGLLDDRRKPGKPPKSLFRYRYDYLFDDDPVAMRAVAARQPAKGRQPGRNR